MSVEVHKRAIVIRGETQPRTEYLIFFCSGIRDTLGQTLVDEQTVVVNVSPTPQLLETLGHGKPSFGFLSDPMSVSNSVVTLDPFREDLEIPILTCNLRRVKVRVYSTRPEHFYYYFNFQRDMLKWRKIERKNFVLFNMKKRAGERPEPFKAKLWEEFVMEVPDYLHDQKIVSYLNLRPYLKDKNSYGHFIVSFDVFEAEIHDTSLLKNDRRPFGFDMWCQVTNLNLDACFMTQGADQRGIIVSTTSLIDGKISPSVDVWMGNGRDDQKKLCSTGVAGHAKVWIEEHKMIDSPVRGCSNVLLIAMKGEDATFLNLRLDASLFEQDKNATKSPNAPPLPLAPPISPLRKQVFCCYTDRHYYQPGDKIRVFGVSRVVDQSKSFAPKVQAKSEIGKYAVAVMSGSHQIVFQQVVDIPASGMFEFAIILPESLPHKKTYPFGRLCVVAEKLSLRAGAGKGKKTFTRNNAGNNGDSNDKKETGKAAQSSSHSSSPTDSSSLSSSSSSSSLTAHSSSNDSKIRSSSPKFGFDILLTSFELEPPSSSGKLVSLRAESTDGSFSSHFLAGSDVVINTELDSSAGLGQTVSHRALEYEVTWTSSHWVPPTLVGDGWVFVPTIGVEHETTAVAPPESGSSSKHTGYTDASGEHRLVVKTENDKSTYFCRDVTVKCAVSDSISSVLQVSFSVFNAQKFVGLKPSSSLRVGDELVVEHTVCDGDGLALNSSPVSWEVSCIDEKGQLIGEKLSFSTVFNPFAPLEKHTYNVEYIVSPLAADPKVAVSGFLHLPPLEHLSTASFCRVVASVAGDNGVAHISSMEIELKRRVASSPKEVVPKLQPTEVEIEASVDKLMYWPGDIATLTVKSKYFPATVMVLVESPQGGVRVQEIAQMSKPEHEFRILMEEQDVPNLNMTVVLSSTGPRIDGRGKEQKTMLPRSVRGIAEVNLNVSTARRQLNVSVEPSSKVMQPGQPGSIRVVVKDYRGNPVPSAQATVFVVPEDDLRPSNSAKGLDSGEGFVSQFYPRVQSNVEVRNSNRRILMTNEEAFILEEEENMYVPAVVSESEMEPTLPSEQQKLPRRFLKNLRNAMLPTDESADHENNVAEEEREEEESGFSRHRPFDDSSQHEGSGRHYSTSSASSYHRSISREGRSLQSSSRPPIALYKSCMKTGTDGEALVAFRAPQATAKYRARVIVTFGASYFGYGSASFDIHPLISLHASPPSVLQWGDKLTFAAKVKNHSEEGTETTVVIETKNLTVQGSSGYKVHVPARDSVVVKFQLSADICGLSSFRVVSYFFPPKPMSVGSRKKVPQPKHIRLDSLDGKIRVEAPLCKAVHYIGGLLSDSEASPEKKTKDPSSGSMSGDVDEEKEVVPIAVPVALSSEYESSFGGLSVRLSSLPSSHIVEALRHLMSKGVDSSETLSSRMIALGAMSPVLSKLTGHRWVERAQVQQSFKACLSILHSRQNETGAVGMWTPFETQWPFISLQVAFGVVAAFDSGISTDPSFVHKLKRFLLSIKSHIPFWYGREIREFVLAFALFLRHHKLFGVDDAERAVSLLSTDGGVERKPLSTCMLLIPSLLSGGKYAEVTKILKRLQFLVKETETSASFEERLFGGRVWHDWTREILHTDLRVNALVLIALVEVYRSGITMFDREWTVKMATKVKTHLMNSMKNGHFSNSQDAGWCIYALRSFFSAICNENNITSSSTSGRVWLGKSLIAKLNQGESSAVASSVSSAIHLPMEFLLRVQEKRKNKTAPIPCMFTAGHASELAYQVLFRAARLGDVLKPSQHGFQIERTFFPLSDPSDLTYDLQGGYRIRQGARIRVEVKITIESRRYHVGLIDSYPAGFSVSEVRTSVSEKEFVHRLVSDENVCVFADTLWGGTYTLEYDVKALHVGSFLAPPPTVKELYNTDTFARGCQDRVSILASSAFDLV